MDIENQIIRIRINNFNEKHFVSLGYAVKRNEYIEIKAKELPPGSGIKINVECFYCKKIFKKAYRRYLETKEKLCCKQCKSIKIVEVSLLKYGNSCSLRNEIVLNKSKKKNMEKYGVEYPFQNKNILEKCVKTSLERHGKNYRKKTISQQQIKLHSLYGGSLNHSVFPFFLDVFFEKEKIYLEYDGSGHEISIKTGKHTRKSFDAKEKKRSLFLKEKGYKEFRILSINDVFPEDKVLLAIKERAFKLLTKEKYNKYVYNLDTKTESFSE